MFNSSSSNYFKNNKHTFVVQIKDGGFFTKRESSRAYRSRYRDTVKMLRSIMRRNIDSVRKVRGFEDYLPKMQDDESEMDMLTNQGKFTVQRNKVKKNIDKFIENLKKHGNDTDNIADRVEIHKELKNLQQIVRDMQEEIKPHREEMEDLEKKFADAQKKGKGKKIIKYERMVKDKNREIRNLENVCEEEQHDLNELRDMMLNAQTKEEEKNGKKNITKEIRLKGKLLKSLEEELKNPDGLKNREENSSTNEIDDTYKKFLEETKKNEKKISDGLDRIRAQVGRLYEQANILSGELDKQNEHLDNVENKMEKQIDVLHALNIKLRKLDHKMSPMNVMCKVLAGVFILSILWFFLMQFGVV